MHESSKLDRVLSLWIGLQHRTGLLANTGGIRERLVCLQLPKAMPNVPPMILEPPAMGAQM